MVSVLWRIRTRFDSFCARLGAAGCGGVIPVLVVCGGGHNCTLVHVLLSPGEEDGNIAFRIRFSNTLFLFAFLCRCIALSCSGMVLFVTV